MFSIITVCLNAGNNLHKTIESILIQDFGDFNIIVKDGMSTDQSFESIPADERIIKIKKKDKGIYDAMNQALDYADGQYILFLNAGDFFYSCSVLSSYNNAILNARYPTLVYCDYITTGLREYVQSPWRLTKFFLFRTMLCHQVCMIKREYYKKNGCFDTKFKIDADYDFLLRLLIGNSATYKYIKMLGIISTSGGFSSLHREEALIEVKTIRKKHFGKSYFFYSVLLTLTLPSLRFKISSGTGLPSKLYQRFVNLLNRFF